MLVTFFGDKCCEDGFGGHSSITKSVVEGRMSTSMGIDKRTDVGLQMRKSIGVLWSSRSWSVDDGAIHFLFDQSFLDGIGIPAEKFACEPWTSVAVIEGDGGLKLATHTSGEFLGGVFNRLDGFRIGACFHNFVREGKPVREV